MSEEPKSTTHVLTLCLGKASFTEICKLMDWNSGASGAVIKQLMVAGLLEKTGRGEYKTTQKGKNYIQEDLGDTKSSTTGGIINSWPVIVLRYKKDINSYFKSWRPIIRKYAPTKEDIKLGKILDDILIQSAEEFFPKLEKTKNNYGGRITLAKALWALYADDIKQIALPKISNRIKEIHSLINDEKVNEEATPKRIASLLWFFSMSQKDRLRYNIKNLETYTS